MGGGFPNWERRNHVKTIQAHDGNAFTVVPAGKDPYLVFPAEIADAARVVREYRFPLAFSIFSLSFLGAYLLVGFLLPRGRGEAKAADKVFLLCFAGMLVFPASKIDFKSEKSSENRNLAKWHDLFAGGKLNAQFGAQFESWFQDRFRAREALIGEHGVWLYKFNGRAENAKAYIGKENWMFNPRRTKPFSDAEISRIVEQVKKLDAWCGSNGVKLYLMFGPIKEDVYREFSQAPGFRRFEKPIIDAVEKALPGQVIDPRDALVAGKAEDFVFFKSDHHWTDWGAYLAYREAISVMKKDFPDLTARSREDFVQTRNALVRADSNRIFTKGHTFNLLRNIVGNEQVNYPFDVQYPVWDAKPEWHVTERRWEKPWSSNKFFEFGAANALRATILGDSYEENLAPFFAATFRNVQKIRTNQGMRARDPLSRAMHHYESDILKFNTDILVLMVQCGNIASLGVLYPEQK